MLLEETSLCSTPTLVVAFFFTVMLVIWFRNAYSPANKCGCKPNSVRFWTFWLRSTWLGACVFDIESREPSSNLHQDDPVPILGTTCSSNAECTGSNSYCVDKRCHCPSTHPVIENSLHCHPIIPLNGTCYYNGQCTYNSTPALCQSNKCECRLGYKLLKSNDSLTCVITKGDELAKPYPKDVLVDPTMICVLIGLIVMFIVMCVVLRMFSKARFRDQRTVFNSPRMMKMSLAAKTRDRRASHASVGSRAGSRAGSRNPSIQSGLNLNQKSPTNSKGSRESITIVNSTIKPVDAPLANDDDSMKVESPRSPKNPDATVTINVTESAIPTAV